MIMGCSGSMPLHRMSDVDFAIQNTRLPKEFIINMNDVFKALCPEGRMTRKQFRSMRQEQLKSDPSLIVFLDHMFRSFDEDGSGSIDFREFILMLNAILCGTSSDKLDAIFRICDVNGNGFIEKQELIHILQGLIPFLKSDKDIHSQKKSLNALAQSIFDKFDADKDGRLTKEEFIEGCMEERDIVKIVDTCMTLALVSPAKFK